MEKNDIRVYKRSTDNDPAYVEDGLEFSVKIVFEKGDEIVNIFLTDEDAAKLLKELKIVLS